MARQTTAKERKRIEEMSKSQLGSYIMRASPKSGAFRYAVQKFVKKRK